MKLVTRNSKFIFTCFQNQRNWLCKMKSELFNFQFKNYNFEVFVRTRHSFKAEHALSLAARTGQAQEYLMKQQLEVPREVACTPRKSPLVIRYATMNNNVYSPKDTTYLFPSTADITRLLATREKRLKGIRLHPK